MLEKLFEYPGSKIKSYAKIVFIIEAIAFLVAGVICLFNEATLILGLSLIIGGIPASYITNLFLMAFGDLVETASDSKHINAQILSKLNEKPAAPVVPAPVSVVTDGPTSVYVPKTEKQQTPAENKQPAEPEITSTSNQQACQAVLSYALKFSTTAGMRSHIERKLKTCNNPSDAAVYQTLLANSDENLRTAIEKYLNT